MKRLHIITKPTPVDVLTDIDDDIYEDAWLLKAEQLEVRRTRKLKRQYA